MYKRYVFHCIILSLLCFVSCGDDMPMDDDSQECLIDRKIKLTTQFCEEPISNCEFVYLGYKGLSDEAKLSFVDFCSKINSVIYFENLLGEVTAAKIVEREYINSDYGTSLFLPGEECIKYCLDHETASLQIESDKFHIELNLHTDIQFNFGEILSGERFAGTSMSIFAHNENAKREILSLKLDDEIEISYLSPPYYAEFYENIILNNKEYTDVHSNITFPDEEYLEIVFFHATDGLIAIQDSSGEIWTRI